MCPDETEWKNTPGAARGGGLPACASVLRSSWPHVLQALVFWCVSHGGSWARTRNALEADQDPSREELCGGGIQDSGEMARFVSCVLTPRHIGSGNRMQKLNVQHPTQLLALSLAWPAGEMQAEQFLRCLLLSQPCECCLRWLCPPPPPGCVTLCCPLHGACAAPAQPCLYLKALVHAGCLHFWHSSGWLCLPECCRRCWESGASR